MTPTTPRTPAHGRWDCHACGDCCRLYDLGPVEPHIIDGLVARDIARDWAPAAEAPWYEVRRAPDGRELFFFTHRDGHCVFLRPDNLCAVHGLHGADAKPSFCREFPFHLVDDPRGTVAVVRPSCSSVHRGFQNGTPMADQADAVAALPRVMGRRRWSPPEVAVFPEATLPVALWMDWEERVLRDLESPGSLDEALSALRATLASAVGRSLPAPDPRRARLAANAVIEALRRLMERAAHDPDPRAEPHRVAFARDAHALLERALRGEPRPLTDEARDYQRLLLRSFLLAKGHASIGSVAEGLGFFAVQSAVVRAAATGDGPITAAQASAVVVTWTRLTENPAIQGVLRMARPALLDTFLHLEP